MLFCKKQFLPQQINIRMQELDQSSMPEKQKGERKPVVPGVFSSGKWQT